MATHNNAWKYVIVSNYKHDRTSYVGAEIFTNEDEAHAFAKKLSEQPHNSNVTFIVAQVSSGLRVSTKQR